MKISILLPTNRKNPTVFKKIKDIQDGIKNHKQNRKIFNDEFIDLIKSRTDRVTHYLEPTLRSLQEQTFKDYELIISHRYPEDAIGIVKEYDVPIKLVREKHSIWHDLGPEYGTLNNNINTAFIHSSGELLWRLDDLTFFNENTLQELYDAWKNSNYMTSRGMRCIEFDEDVDFQGPRLTKLGALKDRIEHKMWRVEHKPLTKHPDHSQIPTWMIWGFSSTVSRDEFLAVNGQDELFDGAICGTDMDLGARLMGITKHDRIVSKNYVYEINDVPYKHNIRDDTVLRVITGQSPRPKYFRANTWKPEWVELRRYSRWHKKNIGDLDENWDKLVDIPYINLEEEYEKKELGEVMHDNITIEQF